MLRDVALSGSELAPGGSRCPRRCCARRNRSAARAGGGHGTGERCAARQAHGAGPRAANAAGAASQPECRILAARCGRALAAAAPRIAHRLRNRFGTGLLDLAGGAAAYQGSAAIGELRLEERDRRAAARLGRGRDRFVGAGYTPSACRGRSRCVRPKAAWRLSRTARELRARAGRRRGCGGGTPQPTVERLRIENGTLHRPLAPQRVRGDPARARGRRPASAPCPASPPCAEPPRAALRAARIRGTIDLNAPANLADITANLRNLRLEAFNPYIAKFAGYRIASVACRPRCATSCATDARGCDAGVREHAAGRELERKGLVDLRSSSRGTAGGPPRAHQPRVPVRGSLSDRSSTSARSSPRRSATSCARSRARRSARSRGCSAAVATAANPAGGVEPGLRPTFATGRGGVAQLAEGLAERPQLAVEVHRGFDPARDPVAPAHGAARCGARRRGGCRAGRCRNPKVIAAAERLYLERGGTRASLHACAKAGPLTGRALLAQLAAATSIGPAGPRARPPTRCVWR